MATLTEEETAFAKELKPQEIPAKLRCGMCDTLAVNAVKLPCCETSICANCQAKLTEQCPICEHSPVSADACTPMRSLRMTIKAHLKTEMKRRAAAAAAAAPPPPKEPTPEAAPVVEEQALPTPPETSIEPINETATAENGNEDAPEVVASVVEGTADAAVVDSDTPNDGDQINDEEAGDEELEDDMADDKSDIEIITERPEHDMQAHSQVEEKKEDAQHQEEQTTSLPNGNAQGNFNNFNQAQQGFGGMDFNTMGGYNPMMAMQGMGMPNFAMGGMPNMMGKHNKKRNRQHHPVTPFPGMPGMNMMDPTMMMNQMAQFGGMGDMNNMMASMMGGAYGGMPNQMGGPNGFGNAAGGYNRFGMNYNQQQQQMPFNNARGFNRPYGRGFRGRGGYGFDGGRGGRGGGNAFNQFGPGQNRFQQQQQQNGFQQNGPQNEFHNGSQQQDAPTQSIEDGSAEPSARRGSPVYESMKSADGATVDNVVPPRRPSDVDDTDMAGDDSTNAVNGNDGSTGGERDADVAEPNAEQDGNGESTNITMHGSSHSGYEQTSTLEHVADTAQAVPVDPSHDDRVTQDPGTKLEPTENDQQQPNGTHELHAIPSFDSHQQQNRFKQPPPVRAITPPVNAPTGPKAMRQGLPNNGRFSRPQPSQPPIQPNGRDSQVPTGPSAVRGRSAESGGHKDDRGRDDSRSRSRSKHKSRKHRYEEDEYESDATYERRKERERRKRKERDREERDGGRSNGKARSRSASPVDDSSSRRHRHREDEKRSRRDRSRDKRKSSYRDEEEDDSSSRRKSKSHRSRDEPDDREKEKSTRHSSRREDDDRKDKDRSSKHSRHPSRERDRDRSSRPSVSEQPSSDDIGFKIKGSHSNKINPRGMPPPSRSGRHNSTSEKPAAKAATSSDPYAEERERHKAERALKEQQRRQSTSLGKRGREEEGGEGGAKKKAGGRTMKAKYEDEITVGDGEREREAGRWR
ncbi:hypothetical protein B0A48_05307 [Cryoendolithus antarcticus]|uniref:RING-type domain-containing protein n=1 Tax=Cryoendolithus antarcticus TaxID=1507870 RepID=A0A1V8TIJ3_9PEZI|nr:hypothetical protein B0A48_05307 [Cryoendolithus antarcticus]